MMDIRSHTFAVITKLSGIAVVLVGLGWFGLHGESVNQVLMHTLNLFLAYLLVVIVILSAADKG